jgi:ssDNA-binding Zn-finger/Zn-ribbon topoisomerase 1
MAPQQKPGARSRPMTDLVVPCGECGTAMVLKQGRYGRFWACPRFPACRGRHAAHQSSGLPMGVPTNEAGIRARRHAHAAFDPIWQRGGMTRRDAYRWLTKAMGATKQVHIGEMSVEECERVERLCAELPRPEDADNDPDGMLGDGNPAEP